MDRPNQDLDAWSIPKRKPPPQQEEHRSMDMVIPRKPSTSNNANLTNLMTAAIPRRQSGGPPKLSFNAPIPRRNSNDPHGQYTQLSSSSSMTIPRKKAILPMASKQHSERPSRSFGIYTTSEYPFLIRIPLKGVPLHLGGIPRNRASLRTPKRKRPTYQELADTDSDDFLTDSEEEAAPSKKKIKPKNKRVSKANSVQSSSSSTAMEGHKALTDQSVLSTGGLLLDSTSFEAPPPGTLSTLWYSREIFLNVFIVEKVLAWKTRAVTSLEWVPESIAEEGPPTSLPAIDLAEAAKMSNLALTNPAIWNDPNKRMEVSRLVPEQCPIVMTMACQAHQKEARGARYRIRPYAEKDREEVYLVKWRGRSHMHASWERGSDIIKYDQSKNTARHKIRRFVQSQEIAFGIQWKQVLEEERKTAATIHAHGEQATANTDAIEEEYFPPACTEVERILACDESDMDLTLFAKQRAENIKKEQDLVQQKESGNLRKWNSKEGLEDLLKGIPWDPEDNVRYVVKWKGVPFAEMTWEYWRDIKRDAVDDAEDFWIRQRPPGQEIIEKSNKPHPHVREFRKIQESPVFGMSERERPIFQTEEEKEKGKNQDDIVTSNPGFRLRSYQLEGVNWLLFNWFNRRSCILADEMGLGKTIQSMCFLKSLQDLPATGVRGPFLIVAPLSLIGQWQSEARVWAPDLNVVLYHGSADARDFLVKQDFYYTDQFVPKPTAVKLRKQHVTKFHILITTYEVVLKDVNVISKIHWRALIVDEAHRLKNPKSRLFNDLATVPREFCLLLTGTPLANATEELWALLHFADREAFANKEDFLDKFGQLKDAQQVNELHSLLKPYLLRRVKEDVEKSLPPKEETILEVSLTPIQKKYYKAIYERNTAFLYKGAKPSNAPSLMNVMMELRKCCNHPYLVRGAEERILAEAADQIKGTKDEAGNDVVLDYVKLFGEQLVKSSGKMVLISKLLPKLFWNGHKVLIFSQMVRVLDLLEELLRIMKYKYERLDGSTSSSSRAAAVDRFIRKSCQRFVMLLSTRAGGLGLNLTAADIVIIFDSDWNPQNDLQAMARAHRIGQTRAVRVYRLLTAKTYEMHMFHSASMKLGLERAVLSQQRGQGGDGGDGKSKKRSDKEAQAKEIDSLLKKGAYDVFRDEDDEEGQKFMETDIDQLLERNASTVTYDAKSTNLASSGLGSFSKASFVTDTGDGEKDVDLDDPDFWAKAVGLDAPVETPEEIAQMLDDGVKRSRKQVQVFDPYAEFAEIEQRKHDKIVQKVREEKEEKERQRREKKQKRLDEKERKQREREELRVSLFAKSVKTPEEREPKSKKEPKEPKAKKARKGADRRRAIRRAQNEDPVLERLKQAWDVPQRNRAIAACLRFGFTRFCKIRNESNLTSLPIQDLEVFFRSYFYQLSLQVVVTLLSFLHERNTFFCDENIKGFLQECLGNVSRKELDWLSDCFSTGMEFYLEIENQRRYLRLPLTLAEPTFLAELRRGPALRSLRRIFLLSRIQRLVEDCLDEILAELGYEQLGKRGCQTSNIASMDPDLKARLVSTEELSLALSSHLRKVQQRAPVVWWDRSCDLALLIGTFVHGLGNYDAMQNDDALPFAFKIRKFAKSSEGCVAAQRQFDTATAAARKVFDDALDAAKLKDQEQIQAAVAAAAATSASREENARALREGGAAADAVLSNMPEQPSDKLYDIDGDDSHFVTLPRLKSVVCSSLSANFVKSTADMEVKTPDTVASGTGVAGTEELSGKRKNSGKHLLSMPDARILDHRLYRLLSEVESNAYPWEALGMETDTLLISLKIWPSSEIVSTNWKIRSCALSYVNGTSTDDLGEYLEEYMGIGISGSQCGSSHRSLDDGTDFSIGAASPALAQVAYGSDAPRYLRAIGVPMNLTRFAVSALVHASNSCVERLLNTERARNGANSDPEEMKKEGESEAGEESAVEGQANLESEDTKNTMPKAFQESAALRASVCTVLLHYGFPFTEVLKDVNVNKSLWSNISELCGNFDNVAPDELFTVERFISLTKEFGGGTAIPDFSVIKEYVENFLLPHCLRLCIMGNGSSTSNARGSKGEYETAYGTSLYPEYTEKLQTPLPDPCLLPIEHSLEAMATAHAVLRRTRLMKAITDVATGSLSVTQLDEVLKSPFMRKSMEGLPVWWCPWIHDAALLLHASSRGLFSILKDRNSEENAVLAFSRKSILQHIYSTFVADEKVLSRSIVDESPPEDSQAWIEEHANDFPTANVLERRLSFLCAKATEHLDGDGRYNNLPMFDHGAWPRN